MAARKKPWRGGGRREAGAGEEAFDFRAAAPGEVCFGSASPSNDVQSDVSSGGAGRGAEGGSCSEAKEGELGELPQEVLVVVAKLYPPELRGILKQTCRLLRDEVRNLEEASGGSKPTHPASTCHSLLLTQWALANGCPSTAALSSGAAAAGNIALLAWLRLQPSIPWGEGTLEAAAAAGQLGAVRWLRANGEPWAAWGRRPRASEAAARGGHLDVLRYASSHGCPLDKYTCAAAAEGGHLGILDYLRSRGCPWSPYTMSRAASRGRLHILRWAHERGCPSNQSATLAAAAGGHLCCLKFLRSIGCPWNKSTLVPAAGKGMLEVLRWARENGCPWDRRICQKAAACGQLEVLQYAAGNGCKFDPQEIFTYALINGHGNVCGWVREEFLH